MAFEIAGVAVLAVGSAFALVTGAALIARGERDGAYASVRRNVGRSILLGLEILIIADIVKTITIDSTIESAVILGIIVLVRTFLSFSIEIELDGVPRGDAVTGRRPSRPSRPPSTSEREDLSHGRPGQVVATDRQIDDRSDQLDRRTEAAGRPTTVRRRGSPAPAR